MHQRSRHVSQSAEGNAIVVTRGNLIIMKLISQQSDRSSASDNQHSDRTWPCGPDNRCWFCCTRGSGFPPQHRQRVFGKSEHALSIPSALLRHDLLVVSAHVSHPHPTTSHRPNDHLSSLQSLEFRLPSPVLMNVHDGNIAPTLLFHASADIQPAHIPHLSDPLRLRLSTVSPAFDPRAHPVASHVLGEEPQRPPDRLLHHAILARQKRAEHIDGLRETGHAEFVALSHEHVQPDANGQSVAEIVLFLAALLPLGTDRVPDVPFVEADLGPPGWISDVYFVGDQGGIDKRGGRFDGFLGREGGGSVGDVLVRDGVDVNAVHVYERSFGKWRKVVRDGL